MFVPFSGYAPDFDPVTPGIITDCTDYIPTQKGYAAAPANANGGYDALAATCVGSAILQNLSGSYRLIAGTSSHLYEGATAPTWTDVSRGGGYSGSTDHRWSFAQFGDTSLAALKSNTLQYSNSAGSAFADISGAPKARFVDTVPGFVMLADTNEATNGDQADRWWCSAYNDYTSWTASVTTQCTTGRLIGAPGPIRAWKRLGDGIVAYKDRAIFVGRYVGAPSVWDFSLLPGDVGVSSNEAVVNVGTAHFFVGYEDIYYFDGSRPVAIGDPIKKTFFNDLNKTYRYRIVGMHDRTNSLVVFFYPSGNSTTCDSGIVFNYKTSKWGRLDRNVEAVTEYLTGQVTYANIGNYFASYAAINVPYDSPFWSASSPVAAIFGTDHTLYTLTGAAATCTLTSGDLGDDDTFSLLSRIRPRFSSAPSSATLSNSYRNTSGSSLTTDQTVTLSSGKFDLLRSARWHQTVLSTSGNCELSGMDYVMASEGTE